jgi:16S rRNA (guanine527-N7)-methyltransferase
MTGPSEPEAPWSCLLAQTSSALGLTLSPAQLTAFDHLRRLLLEHNARAGLTAITHPEEIAIKHFLDSLTGLLLRDISPGERVADIGSGTGFPGLVLAVARPAAHYTLVESTRKRAAFLQLAAEALHLSNVSVIAERAELVGRRPHHREAYHLTTSRAVAPLPVLLEYCLPLTRPGGHLIAYKGPEGEEELENSRAALSVLGSRIASTRRLALPLGMGERLLLLIEKISPTPDKYPRRPGLPTRRPLA